MAERTAAEKQGKTPHLTPNTKHLTRCLFGILSVSLPNMLDRTMRRQVEPVLCGKGMYTLTM